MARDEWASFKKERTNANKHGKYYLTSLVQINMHRHHIKICVTISYKIKIDKNMLSNNFNRRKEWKQCNTSVEGNM